MRKDISLKYIDPHPVDSVCGLKLELAMMVEPVHPQFAGHPKLAADARQSRIKNLTVLELQRACLIFRCGVDELMDLLGYQPQAFTPCSKSAGEAIDALLFPSTEDTEKEGPDGPQLY